MDNDFWEKVNEKDGGLRRKNNEFHSYPKSQGNYENQTVKINLKEEVKGKRKNSNQKKKGKGGKIVLSIIAVLTLILLIGAGVGIYILNSFNNGEDIPVAKEPEKGIINFLVVGKDAGDLNDPSAEEVKRTDTIMLVNMNLDTKELTSVSIPRDTRVVDKDGYEVKINSLYQYGIDVLKEEVEDLMYVDVNYIVEINFEAFEEFIDAIGGIEVTPEYDMYYTDNTAGFSINHEKGVTTKLNGEDALLYFRWRQNSDGTGGELGDIGRISHQQKFLMEIFKKCIEPSTVAKVPEIIKVLQKNISTNISGTSILKYAKEVVGMNLDSVEMTSLGGEFYEERNEYGEITVSFWDAKIEENYELISKINPDLDMLELRKPSLYVHIENGTGISGLATELQEELFDKGYVNVSTGNADEENVKTSSVQAVDGSILNEVAEEMKIQQKSNVMTEEEEVTYDVIITIGLDHKLAKDGASIAQQP